jgi:hypothetical protein
VLRFAQTAILRLPVLLAFLEATIAADLPPLPGRTHDDAQPKDAIDIALARSLCTTLLSPGLAKGAAFPAPFPPKNY